MSDNCGHLLHRQLQVALFPGLYTQLLSLAVRKVRTRLGRIYHVMCVAAEVTFSLLTSGFVLPLLSSFLEFSSFFLFSLSCKSDCYWIDCG